MSDRTVQRQANSQTRWPVASVDELPPGARKIVEIDGRSVGVFNVKGTFVAVLNICPHAFAPVCRGQVRGTNLPSAPSEYKWGRQDQILACPWHGWEFDLLSGECLVDARKRLHHFAVVVEESMVYVVMKSR